MAADGAPTWTIEAVEGGAAGDQVELEQLDASGADFYAEGPGGAAAGELFDVLVAAAGPSAEIAWVTAVAAAVRRQLAHRYIGSPLVVFAGEGVWYHATAARNRDSIQRFGLDWSHMEPPGIAGSRRAETDGIFLCDDLEGAEWFAGMCRDPLADIWSAEVRDTWLESAPAAAGGTHWVICPAVIPPDRLALVRRDVRSGRGGA